MFTILYFSIIIVGIFLDQLTKILLSDVDSYVLIPKLIRLDATTNTGAAFGIFGDKKWAITFFIVLTIVITLTLLVFLLYKLFCKKDLSKWLGISISLVISGAIGNLIDRIMFQKVRDFIQIFYTTNIFPAVFNIADVLLVVGVIMISIYLLFLDNDAVFKWGNNDGNQDDNS